MSGSAQENVVSSTYGSSAKRRVSYFYQNDVGLYYYGPGHPMKPHRLRMTHQLILSYGLYRKLEVYKPKPSSEQQIQKFHSEDYVEFLKRISPDNAKQFGAQLQKYNLGEYTDCPVFDGLYEFCATSTGCSVDGAMKLNHGLADIAINWSGGLHHAKKSEASGFCYVNDIVVAILELLKYNPRVLYIDIDVHHGDGVEEAFYTTDRVMTVSFHKFGDFFPGTGDIKDIGAKAGKYYSVNVPLQEGMDDRSYETVFRPVIDKVMEVYRPTAVVLQCGADSLTGDRLGPFNLTLRGHASCVQHMKSYCVPLLVLGGGGYTVRNVARCWTYETAVLLGQELSNDLPYNDFFEYYGPDFKLHLTPTNAENMNKKENLDKITAKILQNLKNIQGAPSVQMQAVPPDWIVKNHYTPQEVEDSAPDALPPALTKEGATRRAREEEYYDGDKDNDRNPNTDGDNAASTGAAAVGRGGGGGGEKRNRNSGAKKGSKKTAAAGDDEVDVEVDVDVDADTSDLPPRPKERQYLMSNKGPTAAAAAAAAPAAAAAAAATAGGAQASINQPDVQQQQQQSSSTESKSQQQQAHDNNTDTGGSDTQNNDTADADADGSGVGMDVTE